MPTEKLTIEEHHVRNAAHKAETEGFPKGITIYSDQKATGLRLQMEGRTASWVVRLRNSSMTIGYAYPVYDMHITALAKVRELATAVRAMLYDDEKNKDRIKAYLAIYYAKGEAHRDVRKASAALVERENAARTAEEERKAAPTTWTLRECVKRTIEEKNSPDAKDFIGKNTVKDYNGTFNRPEFQSIMDVPVVILVKGDIERIRNLVKDNVGPRPATKVVTYFRAVMTYCLQNHSGESGLKGDPWWLMLNAPYKAKVRDRRPEVEAVVKTLILAEEYLDKPLPGRAQGVDGVGHAVLSGLWWLVLTCQRANAGMSLLSHDVVEDKEPGWMLASWSEDVMKAGVTHALPIPSTAWAMVDKYRQKGKFASATHDWAFPSERKKGKVHVTASGVYRVLYRLAGRDELIQKKKPKPEVAGEQKKPKTIPRRTERRDLLAEVGIDWWSLHDLRRAITKALNDAGIPGGASAILAHEINEKEVMAVTATERQREDFLRRRQAKVTALAYGGAQHLGLKKEAMTIWCDLILDEYARQKGLALSEQQAA